MTHPDDENYYAQLFDRRGDKFLSDTLRMLIKVAGPESGFVMIYRDEARAILKALARPVAEGDAETLHSEVSFFTRCVKALLLHTNPHTVNEGHAQQWFAVSDAIRLRIEPLLSAYSAKGGL